MERTRSPCGCYLLWNRNNLRCELGDCTGRRPMPLLPTNDDGLRELMRIYAPYAYRFPSAFHTRMVISFGAARARAELRVSSIQFHSIPRINFTKCNTETCAEAHQQQDFNFFPFSTFISGLKLLLLLLLGKGIRGEVAKNSAQNTLAIRTRQVVDQREKSTHTPPTDCELAVSKKERIYF